MSGVLGTFGTLETNVAAILAAVVALLIDAYCAWALWSLLRRLRLAQAETLQAWGDNTRLRQQLAEVLAEHYASDRAVACAESVRQIEGFRPTARFHFGPVGAAAQVDESEGGDGAG
jgi:hypothetical protein